MLGSSRRSHPHSASESGLSALVPLQVSVLALKMVPIALELAQVALGAVSPQSHGPPHVVVMSLRSCLWQAASCAATDAGELAPPPLIRRLKFAPATSA